MTGLFQENVQETSSTEGQIDFVLSGAVTGARTFDAGFGTGEKIVAYKIRNATVDGEFEVGICPQDGTALKRTEGVVLESSNANALVDWGPGTKNVWCELPAASANDFDMIKAVGVFGGTGNAPTCSPNVPVTKWIDGLTILGRVFATNSGAVVFTPDGGFAPGKTVELRGAALTGGEMIAGMEVALTYRSSTDKLQLSQIENQRNPPIARSSDTILAASDHERAIIATSTFTQTITAAATLGAGWWVEYRNAGTGIITLDPNSSETIDGVATLALNPGQSCRIICDGTALYTIGLNTGTAPRGHIFGLTISNNVSDATNAIDIAVGEAVAAITPYPTMILSAGVTRQLDVAYGSGNGGRFDSSISDGTWHVFVISNGASVNIGMSKSLNPTGTTNYPSGYTWYRRIFSIIRASSAILPFVQDGDYVRWLTTKQDVNAGSPGTSAVSRALTVPTGITVMAFGAHYVTDSGAAGIFAYLSDLAATDEAVSTSRATTSNEVANRGMPAAFTIRTNTSGQIRSRLNTSGAGTTLLIETFGYIDSRGRNA